MISIHFPVTSFLGRKNTACLCCVEIFSFATLMFDPSPFSLCFAVEKFSNQLSEPADKAPAEQDMVKYQRLQGISFEL